MSGRYPLVDGSVLQDVVDIEAIQRRNARWSYWRPATDGVIELNTVSGYDATLPPHFHDEDQLTFVLSGRRTFMVAGELLRLSAGHGAILPAGVPHRSVTEPAGVFCVNAYLPAGRYAGDRMMNDIRELLYTPTTEFPEAEFAAIIRAHKEDGRLAQVDTPPLRQLPQALRMSVSDLAIQAGMSREGYSRDFGRRYGMPPHAYFVVCRLNEARQMLRSGKEIATVAADAGFADQSHLGRWFRRVFGTTPGRYRTG